MHFDKMVFYNHFHAGDIHVSREFVKWFIRLRMATEYEYLHGQPEKQILKEITDLTEKKLGESPEVSRLPARDQITIQGSTAYINTWYGATPGFGGIPDCTLSTLHKLFSISASRLHKILPPIGEWAIPKVPPGLSTPEGEMLVLVCNCKPLSGQADYVDFDQYTHRLASRFPEVTFIYTNPPSDSKRIDGVAYADDMFGTPNNLVLCANMSDHCQVIIGQSSGPYTMTLNRTNLLDPKKTFVCFCRPKTLADWAGSLAKCETVWSPTTDPEEAYIIICTAIEEARK